MPAATVALNVVPPSGNGGLSRDINESNVNITPGNSFANDGETYLYCRNTTAGAIDLTFRAHINNVETIVHTESIPGTGTDTGVRIVGPFKPSLFNNHGSLGDADKAYVMAASGSSGDVKACAIKMPRAGV